MLIKNRGAALALVCLAAIMTIGFLFFDGPHCYVDKNACVSSQNNAANNDNRSPFVILSAWAVDNKEAIESLSALGSLIFSAALALFTMSLAQKTAGLFIETAALREGADQQRTDFLRSVKATEDNTAATKELARAAMEAEGAHLYPEIVGTNIKDAFGLYDVDTLPDAQMIREQPTLLFVFKNYGKTPGFIESIFAGMDYGEPQATVHESMRGRPTLTIIGAKEISDPLGCDIGMTFLARHAKAIKAHKGELIFSGEVIFTDFFGRRFKTRWKFDIRPGGPYLREVHRSDA